MNTEEPGENPRSLLEQMCGLIKHAPEQIELHEVRALLRLCQHYVTEVTDTLADAQVTLPGEQVARLLEEHTSTE